MCCARAPESTQFVAFQNVHFVAPYQQRLHCHVNPKRQKEILLCFVFLRKQITKQITRPPLMKITAFTSVLSCLFFVMNMKMSWKGVLKLKYSEWHKLTLLHPLIGWRVGDVRLNGRICEWEAVWIKCGVKLFIKSFKTAGADWSVQECEQCKSNKINK